MSGSGRFCPRCGEAISPGEGIAPPDRKGNASAELCRTCYLESIDIVSVPERIDLHICATCGAIREGSTWSDIGEQDYTDVVIEAVGDALGVHRDAEDVHWSVRPIQRGPNELDVDLTVTAVVDDTPIEVDRTVSVRIHRETCTTCGRKAGDYYAGTVQVRGTDRLPTEEETDQAVDIARAVIDETDDRDAFISEITERPEGVDIRVSTNKLGARIADRIIAELGGSVDSSETLVTEDQDGEGVYRVAFAVRLPRFRPGDILDLADDGLVLVQGDVRGRALSSGEDVTIDVDDDETERIGTIEDVVETTLVAVEDRNAIQILDPETSAAVTIPRPPDLETSRDVVFVFTTPQRIRAIPEDVVEEASP